MGFDTTDIWRDKGAVVAGLDSISTTGGAMDYQVFGLQPFVMTAAGGYEVVCICSPAVLVNL